MTITQIIINVIAGGLLGALGQGIRIAIGLKKLNDENTTSALTNSPKEQFSANRLILSIFIGFIAGALGLIIKLAGQEDKSGLPTEGIITIIAIGYSGADFIEGLFNTYSKKIASSNAPAALPIREVPAHQGHAG